MHTLQSTSESTQTLGFGLSNKSRELAHMGLVATKPILGGFGTTKAQTSLHIRAD